MKTFLAFRDKEMSFSSPQDSLVLIGPPSNLRGKLTLENESDEEVFVQDLLLDDFTPNQGRKQTAGLALRVKSQLAPREIRSRKIKLKADPHTAPGTYQTTMNIGGIKKPITVIVQNNLEVELQPKKLFFVGVKPGMVHHGQILFTNHGNIPVRVPSVKHNTTLDLDLFCRNMSKTIRQSGDKGIMATMDDYVKGIHNDMAGWVKVSVDETGRVIAPGQALLLNIHLTFPEDVDSEREYRGDMRLYNTILSYHVISEANADKQEEINLY